MINLILPDIVTLYDAIQQIHYTLNARKINSNSKKGSSNMCRYCNRPLTNRHSASLTNQHGLVSFILNEKREVFYIYLPFFVLLPLIDITF
jgi:hypothetical protein